MMEPGYKDRSVEVEHTEVQRKSDSSVVASTFIKYAAYIIIFSEHFSSWSDMYSLCSNSDSNESYTKIHPL